jgi:hypothetical protein
MKLNLKISGGFASMQPIFYACNANVSLKERINNAIVNNNLTSKGTTTICDSREVELTVSDGGETKTFVIDESCALPEVLDIIDDIICVTED